MSAPGATEFQNLVNDVLIRHRSILDVITKLQECSAKVNRTVIKSVTACGCLRITGQRQSIPPETDFSSWKKYMETHLSGDLCDRCKEMLETELGQTLFYIAALCSLLDLNLGEVLQKEKDRLTTLGIFNLS